MFGIKKSTDPAPPAKLPGRNDPCHCGSGKKYKKCHEEKDAAAQHTILEKKWQEGEKAAAQKAAEEKEAAAKAPPNVPHKPAQQQTRSGSQKHKTFSIPKFNMPRRIGGG
jgi:SEC-C motif-containing protein